MNLVHLTPVEYETLAQISPNVSQNHFTAQGTIYSFVQCNCKRLHCGNVIVTKIMDPFFYYRCWPIASASVQLGEIFLSFTGLAHKEGRK